MSAEIFVKTLEGKTCVLSLDLSDSIDDTKYRIEENMGIGHGCQRLIYAGKTLTTGTLHDANIYDQSTLHLIISEDKTAVEIALFVSACSPEDKAEGVNPCCLIQISLQPKVTPSSSTNITVLEASGDTTGGGDRWLPTAGIWQQGGQSKGKEGAGGGSASAVLTFTPSAGILTPSTRYRVLLPQGALLLASATAAPPLSSSPWHYSFRTAPLPPVRITVRAEATGKERAVRLFRNTSLGLLPELLDKARPLGLSSSSSGGGGGGGTVTALLLPQRTAIDTAGAAAALKDGDTVLFVAATTAVAAPAPSQTTTTGESAAAAAAGGGGGGGDESKSSKQ